MYIMYIIVSDISLKARCFGLHFCRRMFTYIFNHFYAMRPGSYRVGRNNAKWGPLRRSRSFKVNDFGTNRKFIFNFLLVPTYPYLAPFPRYSLRYVQNRYIWPPLLRLGCGRFDDKTIRRQTFRRQTIDRQTFRRHILDFSTTNLGRFADKYVWTLCLV